MSAERERTFACPVADAEGVACGAEVTVTFLVSGRYLPATRTDPEEWPDVEYARHESECGHEVPPAVLDHWTALVSDAIGTASHDRYTERAFARRY